MDAVNLDFFVRAAAGNPGALSFCVEAARHDPWLAFRAIDRAIRAGVTGERLYILWNDRYHRDTVSTMKVLCTWDKYALQRLFEPVDPDLGFRLKSFFYEEDDENGEEV